MLYTTYNLAVKHNACEWALTAWEKHVKKLDKDAQIPLTTILEVLGIEDCFWAFRTVEDEATAKTIAVKFAIACADRVLINYESKYPKDDRVRKAIEAAQNYLLHPTEKNRSAAQSAASAAQSAASAAQSAASAAWSAASAAWSAAESAAESAARSAESAARSAESAARSAESAAWSAAWSAARSAESAAWSAAESARSAEIKWQTAKLKELLES